MNKLVKALARRTLDSLGLSAVRRQNNTWDISPRIEMGRDYLADVRYILGSGAKVIFDVGANYGQTMLAMAATFPHAEIYSFEPNPEAFLKLAASASRFDSVHAHNVALGSKTGEAKLFRFAMDQTNSLLPKAPGSEQFLADPHYMDEVGATQVNVETIDLFCAKHTIEAIDLLKTDAQGFDLEVLKGARGLLDTSAIALVYTEVCFVPLYEGQPLFPEIYDFLYERGYRLVALYDSGFRLTHNYHPAGDVLFVHERYGSLKKPELRIALGPIRFLW